MKTSHIHIILCMVLILITHLECHGLCLIPESPEQYRQGELAAMRIAKEDAISDNCFNSSPNYRMRIYKNKKKHIARLKKNHSPSFISGFSHNYAYYFHEYMNLYCGN